MIRNLIVALVALLLSAPAIAEESEFSPSSGGWFEGFTKLIGDDGVCVLDIGITRSITPEWGLQGFIIFQDGLNTSSPWGEGLIGPTYRPIPEIELWLGVGAQIGIEHVAPRFVGSFWAGKDEFSFYGWVEWDISGLAGVWYHLQLRAQALGWLRVTLHIQRYSGVGPRIDILIPETPLTLWGSYLPWDPEEGLNSRRGVLGLVLGF